MEWVKKGYAESHIFLRTKNMQSLQDLWRAFLDESGFAPLATIDELVALGAVYVDRERLQNSQQKILPAQLVEVYSKPKRYPTVNIQERLIEENSEFLVIHKPGGVPCHPTVDNAHENILSACQEYLGAQAYLPHRLDQKTEGLLIVARDPSTLEKFNTLFRERQIEKKYLALVKGHWQNNGLLRHFMKPGDRSPKTVSTEAAPGWHECLLEAQALVACENFSLLQINLLTGRTHQIRAQLADSGHPIVGDEIYGDSKDIEQPLSLCCFELSFHWKTKLQNTTFSLWKNRQITNIHP